MAEPTLRRALQHLLVGLHKAEGTDDAALLTRFAAYRDETAFELIVFRHGPMVRGTCRRLLRHEQDAEDAFQATFLALARKAASVRESLGGWLYRVACHAALKARARVAKRQASVLAEDVARDCGESSDMRELRTVLDEEVLRLPERFRLPVVLCYLQGKSNSQAATELGCPRGTVDSRLSEARRRLRGRLAKRGLAPASVAALEQLLVPSAELSAAAVRPVVTAALAFASHHPASTAAIPASAAALAHGVLHVMVLNQMKWAACVLLALCTLGTGGLATFRAAAGDPPAKEAKAPPAKTGKVEVIAGTLTANSIADGQMTTRDVRRILQGPAGLDKPIENMPLREALQFLGEAFKVTIRIDPSPFKRLTEGEPVNANPFVLYDQPVTVPITKGLSVGEILRDLLAQVKWPEGPTLPLTYLARNKQIVIVPAYQTPHGRGVDGQVFIPEQIAEEQALGDWVSVDYTDMPLADVLRDLADQTGANVVLDARKKDIGKTPITVSLQQVRLFKALQVIADMADLKPVALHNVYYVTDPKNAEKLEKAERPTNDAPTVTGVPNGGGMLGGPQKPSKP